MKPKISVIIPVYNVEKYVERCVRSIMNQTYGNLEIICVNDGSPDNSLAILERLQKEDDRIIIVSKENGGLGDARNYGYKYATSEWISFIDSDDWLRENAYEVASSAFEHNPDLIHFGTKIVLEDCGISAKTDDEYYSVKWRGLHQLDAEMIEKTDVAVWNKLFRKSVMDKFDIHFEKIYYEDYPFVMQYFLSVKTIFCIQDKLHYYLRRTGSIMFETFNRSPRAMDHMRAFEFIEKFARKNNVSHQDDLLGKSFSDCYYFVLRHISKEMIPELVGYAMKIYRTYPYISDRYRVVNKYNTIYFESREKQSSLGTKVMEKLFSIRKEWHNYEHYKVVRLFTIPIYKKPLWLN